MAIVRLFRKEVRSASRARVRRLLPSADRLEARDLLAAFAVVPLAPGSAPADVAVGADGSAWVTLSGRNGIARFLPGSTRPIETTGLIASAAASASQPTGIDLGPDGNLAVTFAGANSVRRYAPAVEPIGGSVAATANAAPNAVAIDPEGTLWVAEPGTPGVRWITADGTSGSVSITVNPSGTNPSGFPTLSSVVFASGAIVVASPRGDALYKIDPATRSVTTLATFTVGSRPTDLAPSDGNAVWVTLAGSRRLARVNLANGQASEFILPADTTPQSITRGKGETAWFTAGPGPRIGRIDPSAAGGAGVVRLFAAPAELGALDAIDSNFDGYQADPNRDVTLWAVAKAANRVVAINTPELLAVTAKGPTAVAGTPTGSVVVATFSTQAIGAAASDFKATVQWDDGVTATSTVPGSGVSIREAVGGGFEVLASRTYPAARAYQLTVAIDDGPGASGLRSTSTATVNVSAAAAEAAPLSGRLAPYSDSGVSNADGITNVNRPTFLGEGTPYSVVLLSATRLGSLHAETRPLGQAIVNGAGDWSLTSEYLPDGGYVVTGTMTPPGGSPSSPVVLTPVLAIDTQGPRVSGLTYAPQNHAIIVSLSDAGAGLDEATARDPRNYTILPGSTVAGFHPARQASPALSPSISGFYSTATAATVTVDFVLAPSARRRMPLFQVASGGVADLAGNPLDGEFLGNLPSGNGAAGGNFIAKLVSPYDATPPGRPGPAARGGRPRPRR